MRARTCISAQNNITPTKPTPWRDGAGVTVMLTRLLARIGTHRSAEGLRPIRAPTTVPTTSPEKAPLKGLTR
jgi:hypothetical protein